jgi:hypothetical protein
MVWQTGGLLECASAFLAQLYYADWSAALTIAGVATLLCVATRGILGAMGMRTRLLHLVTGLLFLWPYNRYWNQLTVGLGVLAALLAVWAYAALPWRRAWARFAAFLVLALGLYFAAGGFCALLALLCALVEVVSGRRWVLAAACAACGFLIPWGLGVQIGGLFWEEAFVHVAPVRREARWVSGTAGAVLYAFCALAVLVPAAARALRERPWLGAPIRFAESRAGLACSAALLVLCTCAVFWHTLDREMRGRMRVDVFSQKEQWEAVVREARRLPMTALTVQTMWDVNRALHRLGLMGDEMFSFPQAPGTLLPVTADFIQDVGRPVGSHAMAYAKSGRLLLDLGRVNESEHTAAEALEVLGPRPALLQHMVLTNIVKLRLGVAAKFLGLLAQDPVHRAGALRLEARLRRDPMLLRDPEVQRLRACLGSGPPSRDQGSLYDMLKEQLATNPGNRMALDYLMAYYLVTKQVNEVAAWSRRLAEAGLERLPRHYEEAVLLYEGMTGEPVDLGGLAVSRETRARLMGFEESIAGCEGDRERAKRAAAGYMDTYFFYFAFIWSPGD